MNTQAHKYRWTAKNNSSYLVGYAYAKTELAAIREARYYIRNELYGEGVIIVEKLHKSGTWYEVRRDEKIIFTSFRWETTRPD